METSILVIAIAIMALGILHIAVTPRFYSGFNMNTLWFISGGLAFIYLAFLNIIYVMIQEKAFIILLFCQTANCLSAIFLGSLLKLKLAPQVIVGLILIITEIILLTLHTA